MYDGNRVADQMRVVVGKPDPHKQTPAYAGYIRSAFSIHTGTCPTTSSAR